MNRIQSLFQKDKKVLSIYFTAGYPNLNDTVSILNELQNSGVDMVEIGLPFSDPLADGPTIQASSTTALENGMTTELLFNQLANIRKTVKIPLLIMGYFNPMMQFGVENFCKKCQEVGIDGLIIPDLPIDEYIEKYKLIFEKFGISLVFLVTPQTSESRIRYIDSISNGFIYLVSSAAVTGGKNQFGDTQLEYFKKTSVMALKNPLVAGFGISNQTTYEQAVIHTNGAIIGSAFIQMLSSKGTNGISDFIKSIRH